MMREEEGGRGEMLRNMDEEDGGGVRGEEG